MKDLESLFEVVIQLAAQENTSVYGTGLWKMCHKLAASQFLPAKQFFIKELDDPRWDWREVSVSLLGFHYKLGSRLIKKIQYMLIHDPESGVRIACAGALGNQSKYPDKALLEALTSDKEKHVRIMAFSALLDLGGVSHEKGLRELERVDASENEASLDALRRIFTEENLLSSLELLDK